MARTGRPLKADSFKNKFSIRLSIEEKKMLDECSVKLGITKTDVIINGIKLIHQSLDGKK